MWCLRQDWLSEKRLLDLPVKENKPPNKRFKCGGETSFTTEQFTIMCQALPMFKAAQQQPTRKCKVSGTSNAYNFFSKKADFTISDNNSVSSKNSDNYLPNLNSFALMEVKWQAKKVNNDHLKTEIVGEVVLDKSGQTVPIWILLDTGTNLKTVEASTHLEDAYVILSSLLAKSQPYKPHLVTAADIDQWTHANLSLIHIPDPTRPY